MIQFRYSDVGQLKMAEAGRLERPTGCPAPVFETGRIRGQPVIVDADVAKLYGVATKRVNEAVRNNPEKFPSDYMFELDRDESCALRSKISSLEHDHRGKGRHSKYNYKAFTEKGLYMLATILKSQRATEATFAIIETFAKVRTLKRELLELHNAPKGQMQAEKMRQLDN